MTRLHAAPEHRVVILGAGRPTRSDEPSALRVVDSGSRVMDWLAAAFADLEDHELAFVSGYGAEALMARYADIRFVHNPRWRLTGPVGSLAVAPLDGRESTWVCYADIVFRPDLCRRLLAADADVVIAYDSRWQARFESRARAGLRRAEKVAVSDGRLAAIGTSIPTTDASGEFAGLARLSPAAARCLAELVRSGDLAETAPFTEAVWALIEQGFSSAVVDALGEWAELDAPQDLARFVLGTKSESLERLRPLVKVGFIDDLVRFDQQRWESDSHEVLAEIRQGLGGRTLIIRSSALSEDQWGASAAGAYESVMNVPGDDDVAIRAAIETVFASYRIRDPHDQVLVQRMLTEVTASGVVMTRTPDSAAPYYVFNFDDSTNRTDTVTAGNASIRTVFLHRDGAIDGRYAEPLAPVLAAIREVEEMVGHDSLDIEFACTSDGLTRVLQVRPIAISSIEGAVDDRRVRRALQDAATFLGELQRPQPFLLGRRTRLSVMSDWNPAEIIGIRPRRLAFSLYRWLITDHVWAVQRAEYGYRDVRPCNLLVDVLGHPYVDVRATFNSFIPASLPDELATRLVNAAIDRLGEHPELHDKVEFDVLFTCLTFDFHARARERLGEHLSEADIALLGDALRVITAGGIRRTGADLDKVDELERRFERIRAADVPPLQRAWLYLEDLRRIGTPTFAHLARSGFVAVSLLRSLSRIEVLPKDGATAFISGLETASSAIQRDAERVAGGELSWAAFVAEYGHLRPGTYDITSPHYAAAPESFLGPMVEAPRPRETEPGARWSPAVGANVAAALREAGLPDDVEAFVRFLGDAIVGRERSKFVFTRNLSAALESLAEYGAALGLDRDTLAHVPIDVFWGLRGAQLGDAAEILRGAADDGVAAFRLMQAVQLPGQIESAADLVCFEKMRATPNFVTETSVRARTVFLTAASSPTTDVAGCIAIIPNADPGFDWLFGRSIAGLITMYGGSNSHMAIRAAEFKLPAAIGVEELLFEQLSRADVVELDCASRVIRIIR